MRSKLSVAVVCAVLAGALAISLPAGANTAPPRAPAQAGSGDPIKIGITFPCDSPTPPALCEIGPSGIAAVKAVNAAGGVKTADGKAHRLETVVCENENDRATTADCARQFVREGIAYAIGGATFADEFVPIIQEAGIPFFSPTLLSTGSVEGSAPNTYILGFTLGLFQGLVEQLVQADYKKIVGVAQGQGVAIGGLTEPIAEAAGATLEIVEAPLENPNWSQVVEQATEDADVIMLVFPEQQAKAFLDAYTQAGKDIPVTSVIGIVTNDLIEVTGAASSPLTGGLVTGFFPPPEAKAWADFRKGMKKYAKSTQLEPAGQNAWLAIQLASEIMKGIDGDVTAASFTAAVDGTTSIPTLGGKLPPGLSFQQPEGIFPRIFNNDYWGPLKSTGKGVVNGKGAKYLPAPSAG
jgi:ABC-type branched-subunit amino acid transport system substrate-binding protein